MMTRMFLRREKPHQFTFEERIGNLKQAGFESRRETTDRARGIREGCVALVESLGKGDVKISKVGFLVGDEIAGMVNHGYQMFLTTPAGTETPAQAQPVKKPHACRR